MGRLFARFGTRVLKKNARPFEHFSSMRFLPKRFKVADGNFEIHCVLVYTYVCHDDLFLMKFAPAFKLPE